MTAYVYYMRTEEQINYSEGIVRNLVLPSLNSMGILPSASMLAGGGFR